MIKEFTEKGSVSFKVMAPLYLPFYNRWNENAYYKYEPFDLDPFSLNAVSTSGSPVVVTPNGFYGFLSEVGGRFSYDGKGTLTVCGEAGQRLYYCENCDPYAEWGRYSDEVLKSFPKAEKQDFWSDIEYCTWVEQKKDAVLKGNKSMHSQLCEGLVYNYMDRVDRMGLPKGKITIDDGWYVRNDSEGRLLYGEWEIDTEKFPDMERLVRDIKARGFIPGLWFAPFTFTPNCKLAKAHPELIGGIYSQNNELGYTWVYIKPNEVLREYYTEIFTKYIGMGFQKFKLDIAYGPKRDMKALLKMMYEIIKSIDPTVEVECHIPDIFVSRYCDTVRMNDVNFDDKGLWRGTAAEHHKVCRYSSPHMILNLDHLGTNTPTPKEGDYLEHTRMILSLEGGYPCVSLLPDLFGESAVTEFVAAVNDWKNRNNK